MTARPGATVTVLGGDGAWPRPGGACNGYLVEHDGFRLLIDPGYATFPRLLEIVGADQVDAVYVTHGHPDHCSDLNPLLRARALVPDPPAALPVYAPPGELSAVLALDRPGMLDDAVDVREFEPGSDLAIGPFRAETRLLPHSRTNAGIRLDVGGGSGIGGRVYGGRHVVFTGDTGPSPALTDLARSASVLVAEASYAEHVPDELATTLSSAALAGKTAAAAGVSHLVLAHLFPDTSPDAAIEAAARAFDGPVTVARPGVVISV